MCGRFALSTSVSSLPIPLRERLDSVHRARYEPRDLIKPGEPLLALRRDERGTSPALMLWGLIPAWCQDPLAGPRPFNARCETLGVKPTFRGAWRHRRRRNLGGARTVRSRRRPRVPCPAEAFHADAVGGAHKWTPL